MSHRGSKMLSLALANQKPFNKRKSLEEQTNVMETTSMVTPKNFLTSSQFPSSRASSSQLNKARFSQNDLDDRRMSLLAQDSTINSVRSGNMLIQNDDDYECNDIDPFQTSDDSDRDPNYESSEYEQSSDNSSDEDTELAEIARAVEFNLENNNPNDPKPSTSNRKSRKIARSSGQSYRTESEKTITARKMKSLPGCRKNCKEKISEQERLKIFNFYWALGSYDLRARYINGLICMENTKSSVNTKHSNTPRNRQKSFYYFLEKIGGSRLSVCQKCFKYTFDESDRFIRTIQEKKQIDDEHITFRDRRGKSTPANIITPARIEEIKNFILSIPAYESHYRRADSSQKYFHSDMTMADLYNQYTQRCANVVSLTKFREVFSEMNIKFKKPQLDTCNVCDAFKLKIDASNGEEKISLLGERDKHHKVAQLGYESKSLDKEKAKLDPNVKVCTFDLQRCLPTPLLNTNISFYKRLLWTFNLTIYDCGLKKPYNNMWHEGIGNRGGNEIASSLYEYLINLPPNVTSVIMYSDNSGGQNKNSIVATMFALALLTLPNIQSIEHKFLTSGHTHMECDTIHSAIEKKKKKTTLNIHHPRDWYSLVENISNKYEVVRMDQTKFVNFAEISKTKFCWRKVDAHGNKFVWRDVSWFKFTKEYGVIQYKNTLNESEPFKNLKVGKRGHSNVSCMNLPLCYSSPIKISDAKKKDLIDLLPFIDSEFHGFYQSLNSEELPDVHPDLTEMEEVDAENM